MSSTPEAPAVHPRVEAHARALQRELVPAVEILVEILGKALTAVIVGRDLKTIGRWLAGQGPRRDDEKRRIWDSLQIVELLLASHSPSTVCAWFIGMNPALDDESPAQVLAEDGRARAVMAAARAFVIAS
jgi:hypothetical protein